MSFIGVSKVICLTCFDLAYLYPMFIVTVAMKITRLLRHMHLSEQAARPA